MHKIFFIPFALSFIYCSNQMKLNAGKDVDIILQQGHYIIREGGKPIEYLIKNKTENTYIIDPFGFYGYSYVLENNKILEPYMKVREMHYYRDSVGLCQQDLIILKPRELIYMPLNLNMSNRSVYRYSLTNKYEEVIKSVHNRSNSTILGCDDYIKDLEKKGYIVLEDSIRAKIPIVSE